MAFDGIFLHAIIDELNGLLSGGRVEKIFQPEPAAIVLLIHASGEHYRLLLSADPASARIHLTRGKKENPSSPPPFCMVLRKYLTGARITSITQQGFDRVAFIEFETRSEMGDNVVKKLILEIMNRQSNIILVNSAGIIHDAVRHADSSVNRYREIMPARPYTPPPAQDKLTPPELTEEKVRDCIRNAGSATVSKCLLSLAAGFSPMLCDAVCLGAGLAPDTPPAAPGDAETAAVAAETMKTVREIIAGEYAPAITRGGKDFHCLRVCRDAYGADRIFNTVNLAADCFFEAKAVSARFEREKAAAAREISANIAKISKKLTEYRRELEESAGYGREKEIGELLTSQLYGLPEFAGEAVLTDYYSPGSPEITVALDPSRSVAANAQIYFRRYRKHRAAVETVGKLAGRLQGELDYLENVLAMLNNSSTVEEIEDIKAELRSEFVFASAGDPDDDGPGRQRNSGRGQAAQTQPQSAYMGGKPASKKSLRARANAAKAKSGAKNGKNGSGRPGGPGNNGAVADGAGRGSGAESGLTRPIVRLTASGKRIFIGRNSRQNEKLTLRDSAPDDMWFHVKNAPGSHVVLKLREAGCAAEDSDLETAAALAAFYSSQRAGSKVDVDYTPVKNVKKIPGGRPGMVTYSGFRTLTVEPRDAGGVSSNVSDGSDVSSREK